MTLLFNSRRRALLISLGAITAVAAIACGSDDPPVRIPTPTPFPTSAAQPTATPIPTMPMVQDFSATVSPSVTIGGMVHSFTWTLNNGYREKVTLLGASLLTSDGKLVQKLTPDDIGNGDIEPGAAIGWNSSFRIVFYTTAEVAEFQTVWTIRAKNQNTIVCTFSSSSDSCVE